MIIERVPEARGVLEECLRANSRRGLGVWIDGRLTAVQALECLSSQEGICEGIDRSAELRLLVDLVAISSAWTDLGLSRPSQTYLLRRDEVLGDELLKGALEVLLRHKLVRRRL